MSHDEFTRKAFDGLELFFQCWQMEGEPKGVINLVHGLGEHSGRYSQWANWLNRAGYHVIAYDLRGHGKSAGLRGHINSFDEFVNDTEILLQEGAARFSGLPQFLYGHSLGAIISWVYVLRKKPELAGVILTALDYRNSLEEQKVKLLLSKVLGSFLPKMTLSSGLDAQVISRDPEVVAKYVNDPLVHDKLSMGFAKSSLTTFPWAIQHSKEWNLPVLVMHGELDKLGYVSGSREFASGVSGDCTLKVWQGLYHEIHNEPEKEQVFEFLRTWLDNHCSIE
ncbi:MAG: lysophospholipase [Acidobacteriaceae bacterium]